MKSPIIFVILVHLIVSFNWGFIPSAKAQIAPVKVMVVGSHFLPHDVLRSNRQLEMEALAENLTRFSPDKILVDLPRNSRQEAIMNESYQSYKKGIYQLNRSIIEQLGFRISGLLSHDRLYGVDDEEGYDMGSSLQAFLGSDGSDAITQLLQLGRGVESSKQAHMYYGTLTDYLEYLNKPSNLEYEHGIYVQGLTDLGKKHTSEGIDVLSEWYSYHMKLFANLKSISSDSKHVMIILPSTHVPILKELVLADPGFTWVEPLDYLRVQ